MFYSASSGTVFPVFIAIGFKIHSAVKAYERIPGRFPPVFFITVLMPPGAPAPVAAKLGFPAPLVFSVNLFATVEAAFGILSYFRYFLASPGNPDTQVALQAIVFTQSPDIVPVDPHHVGNNLISIAPLTEFQNLLFFSSLQHLSHPNCK